MHTPNCVSVDPLELDMANFASGNDALVMALGEKLCVT